VASCFEAKYPLIVIGKHEQGQPAAGDSDNESRGAAQLVQNSSCRIFSRRQKISRVHKLSILKKLCYSTRNEVEAAEAGFAIFQYLSHHHV
jgi:hypothetical protein